MIRLVYIAVRERRWNRDRRRRIAEMRQRERATFIAQVDWVEAMASQLAEIRMLPEPLATRR
jgi:hypothetical protein